MIRLKDLCILGSKKELDRLKDGKLLINTINAHSYNTALKDSLFATQIPIMTENLRSSITRF